MSCDFGKQRNKITFRFGTKILHILPDVFFLPFPRPLSPAHAHEEKYGWLARLSATLSLVFRKNAAFESYGVKQSEEANMQISTGLPRSALRTLEASVATQGECRLPRAI